MTTEIERLQAEQAELRQHLDKVNAAILAERFKDVPRLAAGDLVLVPRTLFGKIKWWPAKISYVYLNYSSGEDAHGEPWENRQVSYSVYLRQKDGTFGGSSEGYYASQVQLIPPEADPGQEPVQNEQETRS